MNNLIQALVAEGILRSPRIIKALESIDRVTFLPDDQQGYAHLNVPLPIGYGQTNSQPLTVAWMLEKLQPLPGENILDVGSGSGWTSALLAYIVGSKGQVVAVEKVPELYVFGKKNIDTYGYVREGRVICLPSGKSLGAPDYAPFDRILVSAGARSLPQDLLDQLKPGGVMVVPVGDSILVVDKQISGDIVTEEFPGFQFVPLLDT